MQYTVRALVEPLGGEARLDSICRTFSSMVRTAYNRLLDGKRTNEIVRLLQARYGVKNWRWCQWAIVQAQAVIKSQKELLPLYVEMYGEKISRVRRGMERVADPLKKSGFRARIEKLERKKAEVERHLEAGTMPRAVFGSRKLLEELAKGKGPREEWRHRRSNQFFSIGQANQRGNANTRIIRRGDGYALEVRNWLGGDFTVGLHVPEYCQRLLDSALASGVAYSVRVKRTERNYQALLSFEVDETPLQPWNGKRVAAVDVNPKGLAVTIATSDGNFFASRWFHEPALVHARAEKRGWLAANLVKRVFKWIKGYECNTVIIEKLKFGMAQEGNHRANRACSNFMRKKLIELVKLRALKLDWICAEVRAAYSSIAGELKYGAQFGRFNGHQLAAFVLVRRALGYGERLSVEQLERVPKRRRAYARKVISSFRGHRHELLMPCPGTDGRMLGGDAKGASAVTKRVTPHTATTLVKPRLSSLLGGGCRGDEPRARGHGVNPPPENGVKLGSIGDVNKVNVF
jgi:predicted transposase